MSSTPNALANAHKALDNAEKFTSSVVKQAGGKSDAFKSSKPSYTDAHNARKAEGTATAHPAAPVKEFMGIRSDEGPDLKAVQDRGAAMKELNQ